ncbi:MAG: dynamin family protein [Desulfococcaceae bacterium]
MQATEPVHKFEKIFEVYDRVQDYVDISENLKRYVDKKRTWIDRLKSPEFPVAFLGTFSAGKSMIINAILEKNILPEATKSYTAIPTIIKKGDSDSVVIHFLSETARTELRNLYIEEISRELHKNPTDFLKLNNNDLLLAFQRDITDHTQEVGLFNKEKSFEELQKLIEKWSRFSGETKEIGISELSRYVTEDYEDVLLVDRVVVYLRDIDIPDNVVLVDLPGLGVVNPRHRKITKAYVENDAKAFVISSAVFKLLEGEEIELLSEIHKQRPKVLKRAFWVINKWETASEKQKREESRNFNEKIESHQFRITPDRVFKVSALNYLLVRLIANGELEENGKIKDHLDNLKKSVGKIPSPEAVASVMEASDEIRDFGRLKEKLFDYLNTTAGEEFYEEAEAELAELARKLTGILKPHHDAAVNNKNLKDSFIARELVKRLKQFSSGIQSIVRDRIKEIRIKHLTGIEFWTDEKQHDFEQQIKTYIDGLDRSELRNEMMRGLDTLENQSRLPQKIEERLPIGKMFRRQLRSLMREDIVHRFSRELLNELKKSDLLPEGLSFTLEDKLSKRDILTRINGLCDVFLFEFGDRLNGLGFEISEKLEEVISDSPERMQEIKKLLKANAETAVSEARKSNLIKKEGNFNDLLELDDRKLKLLYSKINGNGRHMLHPNPSNGSNMEKVLKIYEGRIIDFIRDLQGKINDYTRRCIKNYFEELEEDLLALFEQNEPDIAAVIMEKLHTNIDDEIGLELRKQQIFTESYQEVSALIQ